MKKLSGQKNIDLIRHLSFCLVGGFFGGYAILTHSGLMGNAQTMNLIELVFSSLCGDAQQALLHLGGLLCYVLGTMATVLLPHWLRVDMYRLSPVITAICAVILSVLPEETPLTVSLYPIFFAMSIQWSTYPGGWGFYSSTIFSTNNTKQTSLALAQFLCDRDRAHLRKLLFYVLTLLFFHIGTTVSWFSVKWWGQRGILPVLPFTAWGYFVVLCERRHERNPVQGGS